MAPNPSAASFVPLLSGGRPSVSVWPRLLPRASALMSWLIRASRSNPLSWPTRRGGNCRHRLLPCLIVSARCAHLLNLCIQLRPNIPIAPAMPQQFLHRPSAYFPHAFGCVAGRNIPIPIPMLLPPASGTQEASPAPCLVSGPSQGSGPPPPLPMHCPNPRLQHLPPFSPNIPCPDSSYLIPTFSSLRSEFSPRAPSQRHSSPMRPPIADFRAA